MIELPETNVLADQINETIAGKTIINAIADASPHKFAYYSCERSQFPERLLGKTITEAYPGTGYGCGTETEIKVGDMLLVISTPIKYHVPGEKMPEKHQLLLEFNDLSHMTCTIQMWGSINCYNKPEADELKHKYKNAPPTPYTDEFDEDYFNMLREGRDNLSLKAFLATEQRIPGLGNGVLQDILFTARLNPKKKLGTVTSDEYRTLFASVKAVLLSMKLQGGRDTEKDLFNRPGGYKTLLSAKTYANPCPVCGDIIKRAGYLGGSVYFCLTCQAI